MPKLKLATFCEKVIIDAIGMPSLIGMFHQFMVAVPPGVAPPRNALAPKEWAMFFIWECSSEETGQEFSQIFEMTAPSGDLFAPPQIVKFTPHADKLRQNVYATAQGLPIGVPGTISVKTRVEKNGQIVVPETAYSFDVVHTEAKPA